MAHGNTWQYEIDFINGVSVGHKNPMHLTPAASQPKPSTSNPRIHAGCKGVVSKWCKNNDQDVILYWTCTNFYTMIWSKITNKHQQIWFAYHLNYFDRIIYVLICIWFACLRIEDMTPACPEAVSLQDPGASALFRPNSSQTKNQNPKKKSTPARHFLHFLHWAVAALQECGPFTGAFGKHSGSFGKIRVSNLRPLRPSKKTKDAAVVRFVPPARQVKLRKGWLIPLILAASWRRASNFPMRSSNLGDSAALALHPCSHTSKLQKLTQGKGTIEWHDLTWLKPWTLPVMQCDKMCSPWTGRLRPVSKLLTSDSKTPPKTQLVAPETAPRSNTPWRPARKSFRVNCKLATYETDGSPGKPSLLHARITLSC